MGVLFKTYVRDDISDTLEPESEHTGLSAAEIVELTARLTGSSIVLMRPIVYIITGMSTLSVLALQSS